MPPEYVDYLILGDEHHGETYSDIKSTRLAVRSKYASDAKRTVDDEPMFAPKMVNYHVHEYPAQDGRFYLVASNYPLSHFDVEDALIKSRVHPLRA